MGKTGIEWTDLSHNVSTGCTRVKKPNDQSGCDGCYAFAWHDRIYAQYIKGQRPTAPKQYHVPFSASWHGQGVQLLPERLDDLLHLRKPVKIFLGSMTDLFHETMPDEYLVKVWGAMAATPHLTYQLLTKRPERMHRFVSQVDQTAIRVEGMKLIEAQSKTTQTWLRKRLAREWVWPLPNVWLGTSTEDQEAADMRLYWLLQTPAAVRYISAEPLIGAVDLRRCQYEDLVEFDALHGTHGVQRPHGGTNAHLDWVIVGGESGARARPMDLAWARSLVAQCQEAGVGVFVKQLGTDWAKANHAKDGHGGDIAEWPEDLRVREWPRQWVEAHPEEAQR